jgi:hypothetical protein
LEGFKGASFDGWPHKAHEKENLLFLMTLKNGFQIGGFSENAISKTNQEKGKGFLMSVTNKRIYNIKPKFEGKVARYDSYYFVFGNSELIAKSSMEF